MNANSIARLQLVHPELARRITQLSQMLPFEIEVTQGYRSWGDQHALYTQGRTAPGKIVTDADGGYSWHNFGLACDVAPFSANAPDWNDSHPDWHQLVSTGESLGLVSGAEWRTFPDWPHFQLTGRFPASPDEEVRYIFREGGMQAVWEEAFKNV